MLPCRTRRTSPDGYEFSLQLAGQTPGATASVVINGVAVTQAQANASGAVAETSGANIPLRAQPLPTLPHHGRVSADRRCVAAARPSWGRFAASPDPAVTSWVALRPAHF